MIQTRKYIIGTRWDQENSVNFVGYNNNMEVILCFLFFVCFFNESLSVRRTTILFIGKTAWYLEFTLKYLRKNYVWKWERDETRLKKMLTEK